MRQDIGALLRGLTTRPNSIHGPASWARDDEEQQTAKHREIGACVADHVPESLIGPEQLGDFGCHDGRRDHDQQRDGRDPRDYSKEYQQAADYFECPNEMSREGWMGKPNACKTVHTHRGIEEFQQALRKEDQPHRNSDQNNSSARNWNPALFPFRLHDFPRFRPSMSTVLECVFYSISSSCAGPVWWPGGALERGHSEDACGSPFDLKKLPQAAKIARQTTACGLIDES